MTRYLAGIVDLPYITPNGRLVARPGYDPETCLYLHAPIDWLPNVPHRPTADDVRAALRGLADPAKAYTFANGDSAAGMVSGVIAAVVRPVLDLCPAYLIEAATQGSGKTKAAMSLGAVIEGQRPAVTPFAGSSTDDELRKRMVAGAMEGVRFHCLDNVVGHFKSSAMAAVLTGGRLTDRVLGQSRMVTAQIRSLLTLTGNNCVLDADLQRRTVQVRIDGGSAPTHRVFAFDPVTVALSRRVQIAEAVCTVLRAYFGAGAPDIVAGDVGGFADWNRLCRQPVLWLAREGYADALPWSALGDPAASMLADPAESDPEIESLGTLLAALWALSEGGSDFTAAEALAWFRAGENDSGGPAGGFRAAVVDLLGRRDVTAVGLGHMLRYRRDRDVYGLKLLAGGNGPVKRWRIVQTVASRGAQSVEAQ